VPELPDRTKARIEALGSAVPLSAVMAGSDQLVTAPLKTRRRPARRGLRSQRADTLSGGDGNDTVDYSARSKAVQVTNDGQANDGEAGEGDNVDAENALLPNIIASAGYWMVTGDASVKAAAASSPSGTPSSSARQAGSSSRSRSWRWAPPPPAGATS
jgi:hypothetical protein